MYASKIEENHLTGNILLMIKALIRFGIFPISSFKNISQLLMKLLDGTEDRPCSRSQRAKFPHSKIKFLVKDRFLKSAELAVMANTKVK